MKDVIVKDKIFRIRLSRKEKEKFEEYYEYLPETVQQIYIAGAEYKGGKLLLFDTANINKFLDLFIKN